MLARLTAYLRGLARRREIDGETEDELQFHLDKQVEMNIGHGMSSAEARRVALRDLGGLTPTRQAVREVRTTWLDSVWYDARHAVRSLRRNPMFALVASLTLAIGIGANAAVFSVVNSVLLKPLPYPKAEELVGVWHTAPGAQGLSGDLLLSASMFFTYAEENQTFQHFGLWIAGPGIVTGLAEPEEVRTVLITYGTLQALNVQPILGRWLDQADQTPQGPETVMLTYGYWQRRFAGAPSVIGRTVTVGARPREIVGVMPEGFRVLDAEADLIEPFRFPRRGLPLTGFGYRGSPDSSQESRSLR